MSDDGLHTFLFADISGDSALTSRTGTRPRPSSRSSSRPRSPASRPNGAELVKTIGDAVEVHCLDAAEAIALGLRLQSGTVGLPPLHIGIHTGPALQRGVTAGRDRDVGAPVTASAGAGQLPITEATKRAAGSVARTLHGLARAP